MYAPIGGPREPISIGIQVNSSPYQSESKALLAMTIISQNIHDIENVYINNNLISFKDSLLFVILLLLTKGFY